MSSYSCPHFDLANDHCMRLGTDCVLRGKVEFAVPAEERVREREEEKRQRALQGPPKAVKPGRL